MKTLTFNIVQNLLTSLKFIKDFIVAKIILKAFSFFLILAVSETLPYIPDKICGCSAVTVKFDTAVRNQAFGNVWLAGYEEVCHPHLTKTRKRGGYFKQQMKQLML